MVSKLKTNKNFGAFFYIMSLFLFAFFVIISLFDFELAKLYVFFLSLASLLLATLCYFKTSAGELKRLYVKNSFIELKKVVWPNKQETIKTTGIVLVIIFLMAVVLKLLDIIVAWLVKLMITWI